jgi:hypothetical protein
VPARWGRERARAGIAEPLSPRKKWKAITLATLLLVPAFWALLAGIVAAEADDGRFAPDPAAALAFGLAIIPFVYIVLAFLSEQRRVPGAVLKAMGLTLLVGIPASALAGDAVTGLVAGIGSGGIAALRQDIAHNWKARALAVLAACLYTFVLVRVAGPIALLPAPALPFTVIGVADHLSERKRDQEVTVTPRGSRSIR